MLQLLIFTSNLHYIDGMCAQKYTNMHIQIQNQILKKHENWGTCSKINKKRKIEKSKIVDTSRPKKSKT